MCALTDKQTKKRGREAKIKLDTRTRENGEKIKDRHVHALAIWQA